MAEDFGAMKEDIAAFGKRNVTEIRNINRDLTEKALQMRCQGYLAQAKAKLLSETIVEIDQSKKALVSDHQKLLRQNELILAQKEALEEKTQALARSNEDLMKFAHVASHDLKSPLTGIVMSADMLRESHQDKLDEGALKCLSIIEIGAQRMATMIDALLEQARLEAQDRTLRPVEMNILVDEQIMFQKADIDAAAASVSRGDLPSVMGDENQLGRLMQNLLSNALKYRAEDRPLSVRIEAEPAGETWRFAVRDNGAGIPSDSFDHLFDMFKRVNPNAAVEGSGIGLATCKRILELHGGRIWVESDVGAGSTFYFTLPAAAEEAAAAE
jgi:light-regulated signal transduction histidine kinase (bacteriophytochrome)